MTTNFAELWEPLPWSCKTTYCSASYVYN